MGIIILLGTIKMKGRNLISQSVQIQMLSSHEHELAALVQLKSSKIAELSEVVMCDMKVLLPPVEKGERLGTGRSRPSMDLSPRTNLI